MQTIERTEENEVEANEEKGFEFVNKPYAFTQAGGHPWALTTTGEFTTEPGPEIGKPEQLATGLRYYTAPTRDPKDIVAGLPSGLVGNPQAMPRCSLASVTSGVKCPADTILGWYSLGYGGENPEYVGPIVNVTPSAGESAEFVLENETPAFQQLLTAHLVRTGNPVTGQREYGLTVASNEVPLVGLFKFELTFWGVPAEASHNAMRGRFCKSASVEHPLGCTGGGLSAGVAPVPFISLGSDCAAGPETATLRADSWQEPGSVTEGHYSEQYKEATSTMPALTGCNLLSFSPEIEALPDTPAADEPVGLGVNVRVPQSEKPAATATPHLRDAVVTLPEGMSISLGIVDGIQACNESGPEGINFEGKESEEAAANCSSRPGTVRTRRPSAPRKRSHRCWANRSRATSISRARCAAVRARRRVPIRTRSTGISTSSIWNWVARGNSRARGSTSRPTDTWRRTRRRDSSQRSSWRIRSCRSAN